MSDVIWYDENDHSLALIGLKNGATGEYLNSATVAATLYDDAGTPLTGITWPQTLAYQAGSNGEYRVNLDKALAVSPRDQISAKVTAVAGALDATWEQPITVLKRRFS